MILRTNGAGSYTKSDTFWNPGFLLRLPTVGLEVRVLATLPALAQHFTKLKTLCNNYNLGNTFSDGYKEFLRFLGVRKKN